jgi:hypothetical protein
MFFQDATQGSDLAKAALDHYGQLIAAIGALGTAAYGVVDATKGFYGGVSNVGFPAVAGLMNYLFPEEQPSSDFTQAFGLTTPFHKQDAADGLSKQAILRTLKSNWINGMASSDQRAIAKSLIKLRIEPDDVDHLASITGVDPVIFATVVKKLKAGQPLDKGPDGKTVDPLVEQNTYGRFDLVLTSLLDQAYQRGDQRYRNTAKLLAIPVSVIFAVCGGAIQHMVQANPFTGDFYTVQNLQAAFPFVLLGLIATPLAPVAKDLTSALTAGVKLAEAARGKK